MLPIKLSNSPRWISLMFVLVIIANACSLLRDHRINPQNTTFSGQVGPALNMSCSPACHGAGSGNGDWTDSTEVCASIDSMVSKINKGSMPPGGGLDSTAKANLVKCLQNWKEVCQ